MRADRPRVGLLGRLLALSVLVAAASVAATAWLAVHTTTQAIQQQQGQRLPADAQVYAALLHYAASHPGWSGVGPTLDQLARQTGLDITLTRAGHQPIASSPHASAAPTGPPAATVDPLHVDPALSGADANPIDPDAVGPYLLPAQERDSLHQIATAIVACLAQYRLTATIVTAPTGRPQVAAINDVKHVAAMLCEPQTLARPTPTEQVALAQLDGLVDACLTARRQLPVQVDTDYTWQGGGRDDDATVQSCLDDGRREQLTPYVAPAALLFVAEPGAVTTSRFSLTSADVARIAEVTALVLLLATGATVLVGLRVVRPLRALTNAVRAPAAPGARVPVRSGDEIGTLAAAFNALSDRRERAEEQRRAMVGDIAHELRTPVTNIRGWLEGVEDGVADADPAWVASMLEEVLLLQHVIDDLRDLAAADAGELRLYPEPVRPAALLAQVAAAHRATAEAAGVRLRVAAEEGLELSADPVRLRQAVGNLVSNAIRHTPPAGTVTLAAHADDTEIRIAVTDTGGGIEPAELAQVFDRFWRAEKSRGRDSGGSGLGLAIVRQLARAHGGRATVTSEPGQGTTFTLHLPRRT